MSERNELVRYTISNIGMDRRHVFTSSPEQLRHYLERIGINDGMAWTPVVRSRMYAEIRLQAARGKFKNALGGVSLFASMEQAFAPTVPHALDRYQARADTMPATERAKRLATNLAQRVAMPPVMSSLTPMRHIANIVDDPRMFATLYAEEEGQVYNDNNAPYDRATQISPDVVEKLHTTIYDLPEQLAIRGIAFLSYNPYHGARHSQTGSAQLPPWRTYLGEFARRGLVRQFSVALNRSDLPVQTGSEAKGQTIQNATELSKQSPDWQQLEDLAAQLACVRENTPTDAPLDININGDISSLDEQQLRNVRTNLAQLAGDEAS